MSGSKLAVLWLSLLSILILLDGTLFVLFIVLDPQNLVHHDPVTKTIEPGCLAIPALLFVTFIALIPAVGALQLWRTRVRTRGTKERQENEYEFQLEEQLQQTMGRAADFRLAENTDELPEAFISEARGFLDQWNSSHRSRLFRFLSDLGFDADWVTAGNDDRPRLTPESADSLWKRSLPLAVAAVGAWFSLGFWLLFISTMGWLGSLFIAQTLSRQASIGLLGCGFVPALIAGLAGVGIGWLFFQEKKASRRSQAARDGVQELIFRHCTEVLQKLPRELSGLRVSSNAKCVVRALAIAGTAELDGVRKGRLLSLLQQSGWLDRDSGVDLRGANLQSINLAGARLSRARLQHTDLSLADLSRADLQQADLRQCNLREADLRFANLGSADLRGADLRGARCQQAHMGSANLEGALHDGANFWGADLRETVLDYLGSVLTGRNRTEG